LRYFSEKFRILTYHQLIDISEEVLGHVEVVRLLILVCVKYLLHFINHRVEPGWLAIKASSRKQLEKNLEIVKEMNFKEVTRSLVYKFKILLIEDLQEFIFIGSTNSNEKVK
jgi:hypothetical protein